MSLLTSLVSVGGGGGAVSSVAGKTGDVVLQASDIADVQPYDAELAAIAGLTSAANKGIQFTGAGTAATYDLTTAGKALLDDADAAAQRTTLGLGTISTQASSSVTISGGSITGITDLAVADGGTGASTAANARTNLGLVIGTDVQAYDATLNSIAALGTAANKMLYTTGVDTWAEAPYIPWTSYTATLTLNGGGTAPVYSTNSARYCRIGNVVYVDVYKTGDGGAEGSGTGIINIALPVTSSANTLAGYQIVGSAIYDVGGAAFVLCGSIATSASTIELWKYDGGVISSAGFRAGDQANTTRSIRLNFRYEV